MSKIKRSLPEDFDVTDPRDTGNYGEVAVVDINDPAIQDELKLVFAIRDIEGGIDALEQHNIIIGVNPDEIRAYADRLVDIALKIEKPF